MQRPITEEGKIKTRIPTEGSTKKTKEPVRQDQKKSGGLGSIYDKAEEDRGRCGKAESDWAGVDKGSMLPKKYVLG